MFVTVSDSCIGCGVCSMISPEVFEIRTTFAVPDIAKISGHEESCIDAAIECPVKAIDIIE